VRERPSPTDEDDDEVIEHAFPAVLAMPNVKRCCMLQDYEDDQGAWLADLGAALEQAEAEPMQQRPFSNMHQERINDLQGHGSRLTGNLPEVPTAVRSSTESWPVHRRNHESDERFYVQFLGPLHCPGIH
jgi:hypothetical protein